MGHHVIDFRHHAAGFAQQPVEPVGGVCGIIEEHTHIGDRVDVPAGGAIHEISIEQDTDGVPAAHHGYITDAAESAAP